MIPVQRIGHAAYQTPDLARQIDYYVRVIGLRLVDRSRDRAMLRDRAIRVTGLGGEVRALASGAAARLSKLSFQLAPQYDLKQVAAPLSPQGIGSELRSDIIPAIAQAAVSRTEGNAGRAVHEMQGGSAGRDARRRPDDARAPRPCGAGCQSGHGFLCREPRLSGLRWRISFRSGAAAPTITR